MTARAVRGLAGLWEREAALQETVRRGRSRRIGASLICHATIGAARWAWRRFFGPSVPMEAHPHSPIEKARVDLPGKWRLAPHAAVDGHLVTEIQQNQSFDITHCQRISNPFSRGRAVRLYISPVSIRQPLVPARNMLGAIGEILGHGAAVVRTACLQVLEYLQDKFLMRASRYFSDVQVGSHALGDA